MSRIVIFANGSLSQPALLQKRLQSGDRIFCADGGTRHALALALIPEFIIGDLDSLPAEVVAQMEAGGAVIQRHPADKDKTDLELALELATAQHPEEILLLTALGGRLDQMLANLLLLTRPEYASVRITLADGPQWATVLRVHQTITLTGQPGDTLSLIPLTSTVQAVSVTGVKWPLKQATLSLGSTWSISNKFIATQATVTIGAGLALLIHLNKNYEGAFNHETK